MTLFDRAVVGIDESDGGRDAIALAGALSVPHVTLVGAYVADAQAAARRLTAARDATGVDARVLVVHDRSPARALQAAARMTGADLIVVSSGGAGRAEHAEVGDVGRGVLEGSPCPVAVAARDMAHHPEIPRTVIVGLDGGPESGVALECGAQLARVRGARLHVVVVDAPATADRDRERLVLDAVDRYGEQAEGEVRRGVPAVELAATAGPSDLIVVGSRAWGPPGRLAVGSTVDRLVHDAPCPVLVVPRPTSGPLPAHRTRTAVLPWVKTAG